jgi:hypothetical protein
VASGWTRVELTAVLARRSTTNLPLRWSHIALLAPIEWLRREELIQAVLGENLSPAGLKRLLRDEPKPSPRPRKLPDAVLVERGLRSVSGMLRTLKSLEADCLPVLARQRMSGRGTDRLDEVLGDVDAKIRSIRAALDRGRPEKPHRNGVSSCAVEGQLQ